MGLRPDEKLLWVEFMFGGSFQCRLQTDPDQPGSNPKFPNRKFWGDNDLFIGTVDGKGGTFAYDEEPLDEVIRLSNPKQLRDCLMDPWKDTQILDIRWGSDQRPLGSNEPATNLLAAGIQYAGVSLGPDVRFRAHKPGRGATHEALVDFRFSIGNSLFVAEATQPPMCNGIREVSDWQADYKARKMQLVDHFQPKTTADQRQRWMRVFGKSSWDKFGIYSVIPRIDLKDINKGIPVLPGDLGGFISLMQNLAGVQWQVALAFSRFDLDTLTGQIDGSLLALAPGAQRDLTPGRFYTKWPKLRESAT